MLGQLVNHNHLLQVHSLAHSVFKLLGICVVLLANLLLKPVLRPLRRVQVEVILDGIQNVRLLQDDLSSLLEPAFLLLQTFLRKQEKEQSIAYLNQ